MVVTMLKNIMKQFEKEVITKALHECKGNIIQTAKSLGISRETLHRRVRVFKINVGSIRQEHEAVKDVSFSPICGPTFQKVWS
jgi:DNA-binding NtrC family response regulator